MIDPSQITKFDRTEIELQEYFLFCVLVAGKTAVVQARKLEEFLQPAWRKGLMPFEYIDQLIEDGNLEAMIYLAKLGQYKRLTATFSQCTSLDLETCTVEDLERISGVGPKTSRFFILHSRPNQRLAVLDTHILAWMRENTDEITIPQATPQSTSRYKYLENIFLEEADKRNLNPEDFDLEIWKSKSKTA